MKEKGGVGNMSHSDYFGNLSLGQYVTSFPIWNVTPHLCSQCLKTVTVTKLYPCITKYHQAGPCCFAGSSGRPVQNLSPPYSSTSAVYAEIHWTTSQSNVESSVLITCYEDWIAIITCVRPSVNAVITHLQVSVTSGIFRLHPNRKFFIYPYRI